MINDYKIGVLFEQTEMRKLSNKLYAVIDISTNELVSNLTNPKHKFWEVEGRCKNAMINYKKEYDKRINKLRQYAEMMKQEFNKDTMLPPMYRIDPDNLRLIEIDLTVRDKFYSIEESTTE